MSSTLTHQAADRRFATALLLALLATGCATSSAMHMGQHAEQAQDYDRAVAEYTKVVRADPANVDARTSLNRAKLRAAQAHTNSGRRLAALDRYEEALVEYQLAAELNPTDPQVEAALRDTRQRLRVKISVSRDGRTDLESLIDRTRDLPPPGLDLPDGTKLPGSLVFGSGATSRAVFMTLAKFANVNLVFDPAFRDQPISIDLRNVTLEDALGALTASTHTFYRVTAPRTITIVPDSPAKRREYEEVGRSNVLSEQRRHQGGHRPVAGRDRHPADLADHGDQRDIDQGHAGTHRRGRQTDQRGRQGPARGHHRRRAARGESHPPARVRSPDRFAQRPSGTPTGINGTVDINRENFTLANLRNLTAADVFLSGIPGVYYRLLKNDTATRTLANPQLRTSDGITAVRPALVTRYRCR